MFSAPLTYFQKCMKLDARSILINVTKCPANSECEPPLCNFRVSICVWVIFKVRIRAPVFVSLSYRTLYDLYFLHFLPEVMVKFMRWAREHLVMLIEIGMHLIECISGHNSGIGGKCK